MDNKYEYKILVSGSRYYKNKNKIEFIIKSLKGQLPNFNLIIINGDCDGADKLSTLVANELKLKTILYPVFSNDWKELGKKAGSLRNQKMINNNPDIKIGLIFHENLENSKGTKDMIKRLEKENIRYYIYN